MTTLRPDQVWECYVCKARGLGGESGWQRHYDGTHLEVR